ncbi:DUF6801 domain-containing protein [Nocardioides daeguensis]|uniref:Ig-like domain repeat protein n=1 Tax=Nocardioides daeguensis TaxID=908359 RepID=A0ABP6UW43_9ACTN|nr:DUF6801 domain-containing protein [Nocardioides daeguensis]MBV6725663.1 Ig-like domain-containing protein [Nocardioides daeguensis]MCR1772822.1 Ig-like domain-containing protein [Nocardioides daeguensis]
MTLRHRTTWHSVSIGAVLGLAASTAVVIGTAGAASAATLSYDCTVPILGQKTFATDITTNAPATVAPGSSVTPTVTMTMTVPDDLAGAFRGMADQIEGSISAGHTVDAAAAPTSITIPRGPVPASGQIVLTGTGTMPTITAGEAGSTRTIAAGPQQVTMKLFKDGEPAALMPVADLSCTLAPGQSTVISTITAAGGGTAGPGATASSTTVKARYAKKSRKATVTATVTPASATGSVTFTLKKGTTVKTQTVAVAGGTAKGSFKKLKPGRYTVTASYSGAGGTVGASSATTKLKVR